MNFTERFKTYTNTELLRVIDNPHDYQPDAVKTAREVFAKRLLSDEEIEIARKELQTEKQQESQKKEKMDRINDRASSVLEEVDPIQRKTPTADKIINIISIILGILFLYQIYKDAELIVSLFKDIRDWDLSVLIYFLPLIVLPLAAILFYKRQKLGWILLAIFLTYSAVSSCFLLPVSPAIYLIIILFYTGMTWSICKENIRDIYSVSKQTMILVITIPAVILGIIFSIYLL